MRLDSERLRTCPCKRPASSISPLAELLRERVSPEMLYLETKFAPLVSYGLTVGLLANCSRSSDRSALSGSGGISPGR